MNTNIVQTSQNTSVTAKLLISSLLNGIPRLTTEAGQFLAQACSVLLDYHSHLKGVQLKVTVHIPGLTDQIFVLDDWAPINPKIRDNWTDLQEATEFAACGIAILLIQRLTEFTVLKRSSKGTGFDYWLAKQVNVNDSPFSQFSAEARLEVSGIISGDDKSSMRRAKIKLTQTNPSDNSGLPAIIVIVEFSNPISLMVQK